MATDPPDPASTRRAAGHVHVLSGGNLTANGWPRLPVEVISGALAVAGANGTCLGT